MLMRNPILRRPSSWQATAKWRTAQPPPPCTQMRHRGYAQLVPYKGTPSGDPSWPTPSSSSTPLPTPYEIFRMQRGDPYRKSRFYELVKLYHPDRHMHDGGEGGGEAGPASRAATLERYRMVIAANELLSSPSKRRAYDRSGAGWDGRPEFGPRRPADAPPPSSSSSSWSGFDDNSAMRNATWEDWERWYARDERARGAQRAVYVSNGAFVAIVLAAAGLATFGEVARAGNVSRSLLEQMEARHDENSRELARRRRESREFPTKDHRVRNFLRLRGADDEVESLQNTGAGSS